MYLLFYLHPLGRLPQFCLGDSPRWAARHRLLRSLLDRPQVITCWHELRLQGCLKDHPKLLKAQTPGIYAQSWSLKARQGGLCQCFTLLLSHGC